MCTNYNINKRALPGKRAFSEKYVELFRDGCASEQKYAIPAM